MLTGPSVLGCGDGAAAMSESAAMMTAGGGSDVGFEDAASQATRSDTTTADGALRCGVGVRFAALRLPVGGFYHCARSFHSTGKHRSGL